MSPFVFKYYYHILKYGKCESRKKVTRKSCSNINLLYLSVCICLPACVYTCDVCTVTTGTKKSIVRSTKTGVTDNCELPCDFGKPGSFVRIASVLNYLTIYPATQTSLLIASVWSSMAILRKYWQRQELEP